MGIEILLVMKLDEGVFNTKAWTLGLGSALMIVSGYYGELVVTGDLTPRWACWCASMAFFLYIVYEMLVGLSAATASESDPVVAGKIKTAQVMTVISWCISRFVHQYQGTRLFGPQPGKGRHHRRGSHPLWRSARGHFCVSPVCHGCSPSDYNSPASRPEITSVGFSRFRRPY